MHRTAAFTTAWLLLSIAFAPSVVAAPFTHDGRITPLFVAQFASSMDRFHVALDAGETVTVTLAWSDPLADLDMVFVRPHAPCTDGEPGCTVGGLTGAVDGARCPIVEGETGNIDAGLGPGVASFSTTATETGTHALYVYTSIAVPLVPVPYVLTVAVGNGGGEDRVAGPFAPTDPFGHPAPYPFNDETLLIGSPHCKWWWGLQQEMGEEPGPIV